MSNALALDKFGRITAFTGGNRGELLMIQNEGELPAEFLSRITSSGLIKENLDTKAPESLNLLTFEIEEDGVKFAIKPENVSDHLVAVNRLIDVQINQESSLDEDMIGEYFYFGCNISMFPLGEVLEIGTPETKDESGKKYWMTFMDVKHEPTKWDVSVLESFGMTADEMGEKIKLLVGKSMEISFEDIARACMGLVSIAIIPVSSEDLIDDGGEEWLREVLKCL